MRRLNQIDIRSFRIFDLDCYPGVYPSNAFQTWAQVFNQISKKFQKNQIPYKESCMHWKKNSDDELSENSEKQEDSKHKPNKMLKENLEDQNICLGEMLLSNFHQESIMIHLNSYNCYNILRLTYFIPVFYEQLAQIPQDFFIDPLSKNNLLNSAQNLIKKCCDNQIEQQKKLTSRCMKLQELLNKHFIQEVDDDHQDNPILIHQNMQPIYKQNQSRISLLMIFEQLQQKIY
ncbi:hypothetical protein pb186bvf_020778 [Paramecium bursaria]